MKGVVPLPRAFPEYDYDLAEGLLQELSDLAVSRLPAEITGRLGTRPAPPELENFFGEYGRRLAQRVVAAGKKYRDRTAEVMEDATRKTGLVFPGLPQRYAEIWLLATRPGGKWSILESTPRRLVLAVHECSVDWLL